MKDSKAKNKKNQATSKDAKFIKAGSVLLETIGADLVPLAEVEAAAITANVGPEELLAAMEWLGVGKDDKGRFYLPNQIVLALRCPHHRGM
jgi:hypothetical protein